MHRLDWTTKEHSFYNLSLTWLKHEVHKLRSNVDAILIGRRTAEIDDPQLTVRKVLGPNPIRIIADTYRKLPLTLNIFKDNASKNIVLCSADIFTDSKTSSTTTY